MSSAPPSDVFLLPLESGSADTNSRELLRTFSAEHGSLPANHSSRPAGSSKVVAPSVWFVGDDANYLLRTLLDLTLLELAACPVVLYGPSQTGKTVLADAIAKRWARGLFFRHRLARELLAGEAEESPGSGPALRLRSKAQCLSAAEWSYQLREALDTKSLDSFFDRFLLAGAVMIDDLHQLQNSPFAQEQLVFLIDRLVAAEIPVLFTLNQAPQKLENFRPDLVSRLLGGLILPVGQPGYSARQKIALDKAEELGLRFEPDALNWLLELPQMESYPGLLGTLKQIQLAGRKKTTPWGIEDLQALLCLPDEEAALAWPEWIIDATADHFELTADILQGTSRRQTAVIARGLAMVLIRSLCHCPLTELGALFGNRDHSTVLNALESTKKRLVSDEHLLASAHRLTLQLKQIAGREKLPFSEQSLPDWLRPQFYSREH